MKIFKTTLLLTTIFLFASTTFSVAAQDCSKYKSIVQKKICEGVQSVTSGTSSSSDNLKKRRLKKKKRKLRKAPIHLTKRIKLLPTS